MVDWLVENVDNPKLFVTENGIYEQPNVDESEKKIKYHRVSFNAANSCKNINYIQLNSNIPK